MSQFKFGFAVALVAFVSGVLVYSAVVVWRFSRIPEVEQPPCQSCSSIYQPGIPSLNICELKDQLDTYRGKVVRVRAVFNHDAGQISLRDNACPEVMFQVGLASSCQSCLGVEKALTIYSGFGSWYDSSAQVSALGRVQRLENPTLRESIEVFNIVCLESAKPIGSGRDERIKYGEGALLRLNRR